VKNAGKRGGNIMIPVISFVGRHNSGKTTVLSGVISFLSKAGFKLAVLKHAARTLEVLPIMDSEKLFHAGADLVYASSPEISIQYWRHDQEKSLQQICEQISTGMDLIIVEGYKRELLYKIEVLRKEIDPEPMNLEKTIALVCNYDVKTALPTFTFDQTERLSRFIIEMLLLDNADRESAPLPTR
jgi:molybdopterin-guanine dinucleotide biosynthesis protein B